MIILPGILQPRNINIPISNEIVWSTSGGVVINLCKIEEQRVFRCTSVVQISVDPTITNLQDLQKYFFAKYGAIVMTLNGCFIYDHYTIMEAIRVNGGCTSFQVFIKGEMDVAIVSPKYDERVLWFQKSSEYDLDYFNLQRVTSVGDNYLVSKLFPEWCTTLSDSVIENMDSITLDFDDDFDDDVDYLDLSDEETSSENFEISDISRLIDL